MEAITNGKNSESMRASCGVNTFSCLPWTKHSADQPMNSLSVQSIVNEAPVVAIVRRPTVDPIRCIEYLFQAGIRLVEITMDTASAVEILSSLQSGVPSDALL